MWILAWLTVTPVRVVRAALKRVEDGDLDANLVVFDGTELGRAAAGLQLDGQRAARAGAASRSVRPPRRPRSRPRRPNSSGPKLGGEERHVAVIFVDIIGSTQLVSARPPTEVVELLNRFFAVIVEEVDRHRGLVNKFEGDAALAVFGAPVTLDKPDDDALAAARAIAERLVREVPECPAGIGVAAGQAVAGNVGANERFEYTVIGEPVNEAARLSELAKSRPGRRILACADTVAGASESERRCWEVGETVTLRGYEQPTRLATLA